MSSKEFEITLHIKGTPDDKSKIRAAFKKGFEEEITPEITKFLERALLYRPEKLKGTFSLKDFRMNHAGLITRAVLANIDEVSVKQDVNSSNVNVKVSPGQVGLELTMSLTPQAAKLFEKRNMTEPAVAKAVTKFDDRTLNKILKDAGEELKK